MALTSKPTQAAILGVILALTGCDGPKGVENPTPRSTKPKIGATHEEKAPQLPPPRSYQDGWSEGDMPSVVRLTVKSSLETLSLGRRDFALGDTQVFQGRTWYKAEVMWGSRQWLNLLVSSNGKSVHVENTLDGAVPLAERVIIEQGWLQAIKATSTHPLTIEQCGEDASSCSVVPDNRRSKSCKPSGPLRDRCLWEVRVEDEQHGAPFGKFRALVEPKSWTLAGVTYSPCGPMPVSKWDAYLRESPETCVGWSEPVCDPAVGNDVCSFYSEFRDAVVAGDKRKVAEYLTFPLPVKLVSGKDTLIATPKEFEGKFEEVMLPNVAKVVERHGISALHPDRLGPIGLYRGQLFIGRECKEGAPGQCDEGPLKVLKLNNEAWLTE